MDVLTFRTGLETVLADHLGTLTFTNGSTTPAISVRASGDSLPAGTTVTGLEVVIVRDPSPVPVRQYRNEQGFSRWTVYLIDWSSATSLQELAELLIDRYPGSTISTLGAPRNLGPKAQLRVDIQTDPEAAVI